MDWGVLAAFALGGLFVYFANTCIWYKLLGKQIDFKERNFYYILILLTIFGTILNYFAPAYLKMILFIFIQFIIYYFFVSKKLENCVASVIIMQVLLMISELVVALVASLFISNYSNLFMKMPIGICILNISVAILLFLSMKIPLIYKTYYALVKLFEKAKHNNLILTCFITIIVAVIFMTMSYIQLPKIIVLTINSILVILYLGIVFGLMYSQEKYRKVSSKYETSLTSLREYEDIMDKYRVDNHENKNQLLTIRNMIRANDQAIDKYIDKLVDNKIKDNETIFYKTSKIPEGGLRATIYSKLCKMNDVGIDYALDISNNVRTADLIKLGDETSLNICKVIGVFLDNAIEAVENLNNKNIILEMFVMDGYMCIDVSNNYEGMIELDKIANKGYTTKGKGHGYGLSLVDEIIKNDFHLENEKKISRDIFTQELKIKSVEL